ncbi:ATP-binding protein [Leptolyngbya cf. ectocarpi LEGE 11479]|uniref:ATP-binding protein n=1 Tax=Leptolyngbya cf. ectocarpi LEGE 11479 TaxID=1828722 RepID=A0A929FBS6_LEPEC|nr:AAA family ATPase [Leptolyngbya ectocarpi]MBE9068918.1 ATP-binding protein [Leptolyngbya cf. ectocarpi LEGE 11479]
MSSGSPFSGDFFKQSTEAVGGFIRWIAELIVSKNWFSLAVLLAVTVIFLLNPRSGIAFKFLDMDLDAEPLPGWYSGAFWVTVLGLLGTALVIAVRTMPKAVALAPDDMTERKAIKGLRPFSLDDAEVYAQLQRRRQLRDCVEALTSDGFRFGILMGESGCGKTSFLQAGVLPLLTPEKASCLGVYIRFNDQKPTKTIAKALAEQLKLPLEKLLPMDEPQERLLGVLQQAAATQEYPLVLLFDQFEQFFVHQKRKEDRQPFIEQLATWYRDPVPLPIRILVSIRSDLLYQLDDLHQALGYSLGPQEVIQIKKFTPGEATKVLGVIAQTEGLDFNKNFVTELAEEELASREDGLISPVDVQILAWMIERQTADELRAFNQSAFQKFGGVEGLLTRFLERTLDARVIPAQRQSAVKVLLALTDLDSQVRAGVLTLPMLKDTLRNTVKVEEVAEAVNWLVRGDVRLITPQEQDGQTGYELAHERLIPALMRLAGKELSAADRANRLLDRRVNEWLGNNCSGRYLFGVRELWQIERQRPYLVWGSKREQKQRLITLSKRRLYGAGLTLVLVGLLTAVGSGWMYWTPQGQIWNAKRQLMGLLNDVPPARQAEAAVAFAKNAEWGRAEGILKGLTGNDATKARDAELASALRETTAFLSRTDLDHETVIDDIQILANAIQDDGYKSDALRAIATAYVELTDPESAESVLKQSLEAATAIQDDGSKSDALRAIATAAVELTDPESAESVLKQSLEAATAIQADGYKSYALSAIATAAVARPSEEIFTDLLDDILQFARKENANRPMETIATYYAKQEAWGEALNALRKTGRTDKAIGLTRLITALAESEKPELIDGPVVLDINIVDDTPGNAALEATIQAPDQDCQQRTDWWEVITLQGGLQENHRRILNTVHKDFPEPLKDTIQGLDIQPNDEVIIRAHFQGNYFSGRDPFSQQGEQYTKSGYTDQALRGSIANGFKSIRISKDFAQHLAKQEPLPDPKLCKES